MNISECFNQIYNFFKKIFLTIFLIIFLKIFSYLIFAIKTIINAILITFIYLVATILTIIAIPFFWKLNELIHNSLDLFKTKDYSNFFISYCNILINAKLFNKDNLDNYKIYNIFNTNDIKSSIYYSFKDII